MLETFDLSQITEEDRVSVEIPDTLEVIRPTETIIHFGGGVYTKVDGGGQEIWEQIVASFQQFGQDENLIVEQITKEQYDQIMNYRSIQTSLSYWIPFDPFCVAYGIPSQKSFDQIESLMTLSYSVGSRESLFLYDRVLDKYYRLISEDHQLSLEDLIVDAEVGGYVAYYSMGTLIGTESKTVIPISLYTSMEELSYGLEFESEEPEKVKGFAQTFFGESFDFVRRIEESKGTVIYMYGYGEKILTISADGFVEYKEKGVSSGNRQDFFIALEQAIKFVAYHAGWTSPDIEGSNLYLKDAEFIEKEKSRGYRFVFGIELGKTEIHYETGEPLVVEVFGDRITYYTRNVITVDQEHLADMEGESNKEAFSAVNMIAQNYQYMYSALLSQGFDLAEIKAEEMFEATSDQIFSVEAGYLKQDETAGDYKELRPVWMVNIGNGVMYFDLYEAKPIGYAISDK